MALTITEALAELKTIDKRLEKKQQFVYGYLYRQERFKDPLEKDGGSVTAVCRERQSVRDLEERKVAIRRAIQQANDTTTITVNGETRSIADWLVWRREVAPKRQSFLTNIRQRLDQVRSEAQKRGAGVAAPGEAKTEADVVVNLSEQELAKDIETLEEVLGTLDGQLSLKNATVTVDV